MKLLLAVLAACLPLCAQVQMHGNVSVDGARSKPAQTGTSLPGTCTVGDQYFKSDATAGQNLYGCTATNTWTQQAGGSSGSSTGTTLPQVTGTFPGTVATVGARHVSFRGHVWWDVRHSSANMVHRSDDHADGRHRNRNWIRLHGAAGYGHHSHIRSRSPSPLGSGITDDPTTLSAFPSGVFPLATFALSGTSITSVANVGFPATNVWTAGSGPWTVTPTSTGLQGACTTCADTAASNTFGTGTQDFSGAAHTLPAVKGTIAGKPATCTVGEEYFATDATAGQNKYYCTATNTWTQQSGGSGTQTYYPNETFVSCVTNTSAQIQNIRTNSSVAALCTASNDENVGLSRSLPA
jgi:hypothetical protein